MEKNVNDAYQRSTDEEKRSNINLIYSYTEAVLKSQMESLNRLDTKLSAFLALSGVMLRLVFDVPFLPDPAKIYYLTCNTCNLLKISVYGCLIEAVFVSSSGLRAQPRGKTLAPKVLMEDKWYWEEEERCKAWIVQGWIVIEKEYLKLGLEKAKRLNTAILLICIAVAALGTNFILLTFYG